MKSNTTKRRRLYYVDQIFSKQKHKCALTNEPIGFTGSKNKRASLDRIDSSKGYIEGNIQFLDSDVNIMKKNHEQEYFIEICRKIAHNYKGK